jgi:hypothetical protein
MCNDDMWVGWRGRLGTIGRPRSKKTKLFEEVFDRSGACVIGREKPNYQNERRTQSHVTVHSRNRITIAAALQAAINLLSRAANTANSS